MTFHDVDVPARRTQHVRFNQLEDPEHIPTATDFSSVIESDVPAVVQHAARQPPGCRRRHDDIGVAHSMTDPPVRRAEEAAVDVEPAEPGAPDDV